VTARFCRVAVDSPVWALDRPFDYEIPARFIGRVAVGSVVRVPLHGRRVRAFVTELVDAPEVATTKPLSALVSEQPLYTSDEIAVARTIARRYLATVGQVLHHGVPGRYSAPKDSDPPVRGAPVASDRPPWLEEERGPWEEPRHEALLVAPSPAAEEEAVSYAATRVRGGVLVVAPHPARVEEMARALGGVALHGDSRPGQRAAAWAAAREGAARVVCVSRAGILAPVPDLALVWVCGAHERTLKEERTPRLHALRAARMRADQAGAAFVASSPAPPLELWADPGVRHLQVARSAYRTVRPEVVGLRSDPVTPRLLDTVRSAIASGRDALVVITRRGSALRVRCRDCGWYPRCPDCRVGLVVMSDRLRCRGCGRDQRIPDRCASCQGERLDAAGWGSDRLADSLGSHDLGAPVLKVDADTALPKKRPRPAVVVGTFAAVGAVRSADLGAVVAADLDQLLGRPDFRAAERTLGALEGLAGLVGPGGRMLVQTREAEHHAVQAFTRRSYRHFAERELPLREQAAYPPYGVVVAADVEAAHVDALAAAASSGGGLLVGSIPRPGGRMSSLVRAPELDPLIEPLREFVASHATARVDVDPVDVL